MKSSVTIRRPLVAAARWAVWALLAFATLPLPSAIAANAASAPPLPQLPAAFDIEAIDRYIERWMAAKGVVGLSTAIVKDGRLVHLKGYGKATLAPGGSATPVTPETRFAIGSVTKQFACVAILLLAEDGKLSVNDKVARFYPGLTRATEIRLLDLMNHTSGYPDYYPLDYVDRRMRNAIDPDELLRQYAGGKLDFEPGSNYSYSNTGFILLGRIVEKVTGESFAAFLARRIFQPLGMTNTVLEPPAGSPGVAQGHTSFALSTPEPIAPEANGWLGAAGGIYSTPGDLVKWNLALIGGKVLKPESYALMTSPRTLNSGRVSDYGCGLGVRQQGGRQVLSHSGAVAGFAAWNATVPSTRSSVVMFCNMDDGLGSLPSQVFSLLMREPTSVPQVRGAPAAETAQRLFLALQRGKVNRAEFSPDFNDYLTDERLSGAARRLRGMGRPTSADLLGTNERGGLEVSTTRLNFKNRPSLRTLMYRRPDGIVEQFFVGKE